MRRLDEKKRGDRKYRRVGEVITADGVVKKVGGDGREVLGSAVGMDVKLVAAEFING